MIFHQIFFHLANVNYRLVIASRLVLECWFDPHWREVPPTAVGAILRELVARDATLGCGFFHMVTCRSFGMRLDVDYPRWRRWLRRPPQVSIQALDLEEPDPWVPVDPEDPIDDLPVFTGSNVIVYRTPHLAGVWGIWAALSRQGYRAVPWTEEVQAPQDESEAN